MNSNDETYVAQTPKPTFWEKTVEYAFVLQAATSHDIKFIAPLAGKEERGAGDAIFGEDDALILVEFKVDAGVLSSEEDLFFDYDDAKLEMNACDGHHFLVYASKTPQGGQALPALEARTYFSAKVLPSAMQCFERGLHPVLFMEYVSKLLELKKADGRSSSGQISPESLASVVGVRSDGTGVSTVTLYEYARQMFPSLTAAHEAKKNTKNTFPHP